MVRRSPPAPAAPVATPAPMRPAQLATALDLARADMASGAFAQAQSRVDTVLRGRPSADVRAAALVLAGDAAYGMGAYRLAAERYEEALLSDELPPDAPHATLALGWAELRLGRREDARLTWMRVARQFPADPHAPIALHPGRGALRPGRRDGGRPQAPRSRAGGPSGRPRMRRSRG